MSGAVFKRTRKVVAEDCDELGHVNNVRWLAFVGELAGAHAVRRGSDNDTLREQGSIWIVRRHEIDYHRSALPGESIVEETWVEDMSGARSVRHSRFTREADGALLVSAVTTWAYVDAGTQRPRRIPAEMIERFRRDA
jgi:acyl-CoA thioester hydrolase